MNASLRGTVKAIMRRNHWSRQLYDASCPTVRDVAATQALCGLISGEVGIHVPSLRQTGRLEGASLRQALIDQLVSFPRVSMMTRLTICRRWLREHRATRRSSPSGIRRLRDGRKRRRGQDCWPEPGELSPEALINPIDRRRSAYHCKTWRKKATLLKLE